MTHVSSRSVASNGSKEKPTRRHKIYCFREVLRLCFTLPSLTQVRVYPPAQAEHVRYPTWGDALRGAETRPVTSDTLGVRVVGVLGSLVVAVAAQGVAPSGHA